MPSAKSSGWSRCWNNRSEHHPGQRPGRSAPDSVRIQCAEGEILRERRAKPRNTSLAGDIIQVVGSQRFSTPVKASPLDIYRAARSINPSPYMFLLELNGFSLVGASPEIHVRCEDRQVEIRPDCRHAPARRNAEEDLALEKELLADPKERAEHVMLVDLARNDLGRVCDFGTVQVKDLMIIERYSHVMHIVSQVEGQLSPEQNSLRSDARHFSRPARSAARRKSARCRSFPNSNKPRADLMAVASAIFPSTAISIAASPSAPPC